MLRSVFLLGLDKLISFCLVFTFDFDLFFSAKELLEIRAKKAQPTTLPQVPPKDFVPNKTQEEAAIIDGIIKSKIELLKEERAERRYFICISLIRWNNHLIYLHHFFQRNLLSTAEWLNDRGLARVTKKVGGDWQTFGFEENGNTFLYPEEALFLLEIVITFFFHQYHLYLLNLTLYCWQSNLELSYSGTPVSVQQAYQLLLKEKHCPSQNYQTYSHLNRLGYKLVRKLPSIKSKLRQDDDDECSTSKKFKMDSSTSFLLPATKSQDDSDYILNFGEKVSSSLKIDIAFPPAALLPESIRDRMGSISYIFTPKSTELDVSSVASNSTLSISTARNWAEYKAAELAENQIQAEYSDNPLYQGETKPLIPANFKGLLNTF